MAELLPSPPHTSLQHSSLSVDQLEALRSSTSLALVHLEEMLNMLHWGGESAVAGWPTFLSSYQKMQRLLSQLNHHLSAGQNLSDYHDGLVGPPIPSASTSRGSALNRHMVHPYIPADAAAEPWLQTLLMNEPSIPTTSSAAERSSAMGTVQDHEARRQRASRICGLLVEQHDWRGRVGTVEDEDEDEDDEEAEDGEDDEDEDRNEKTDDVMRREIIAKDETQLLGNEINLANPVEHVDLGDGEADAEGEEEGDPSPNATRNGEEIKPSEKPDLVDAEMVDAGQKDLNLDEDDEEDEDEDIFGDRDDEMSNI